MTIQKCTQRPLQSTAVEAPILGLPDELLSLIIQFGSVYSTTCISRVCTRFHRLVCQLRHREKLSPTIRLFFSSRIESQPLTVATSGVVVEIRDLPSDTISKTVENKLLNYSITGLNLPAANFMVLFLSRYILTTSSSYPTIIDIIDKKVFTISPTLPQNLLTYIGAFVDEKEVFFSQENGHLYRLSLKTHVLDLVGTFEKHILCFTPTTLPKCKVITFIDHTFLLYDCEDQKVLSKLGEGGTLMVRPHIALDSSLTFCETSKGIYYIGENKTFEKLDPYSQNLQSLSSIEGSIVKYEENDRLYSFNMKNKEKSHPSPSVPPLVVKHTENSSDDGIYHTWMVQNTLYCRNRENDRETKITPDLCFCGPKLVSQFLPGTHQYLSISTCQVFLWDFEKAEALSPACFSNGLHITTVLSPLKNYLLIAQGPEFHFWNLYTNTLTLIHKHEQTLESPSYIFFNDTGHFVYMFYAHQSFRLWDITDLL